MVFSNTGHNYLAKSIHAMNGRGLCHVQIVIMCITCNSIGKHPKSHRAFLNFRETKLAEGFSLQFEVVNLPQILDYLQKEFPTHPQTTAKYDIVVQWIVGEVVGVEHALAFHPLP
jgi:hypothetical protein